MKAFVKICGISNVPDALLAARLGADYIGMIFSEKSPRYVCDKDAAQICSALESGNFSAKKTGVFTCSDADLIVAKADRFRLSAIQLHGGQSEDFIRVLRKKTSAQIWKAVWLANECDVKAASLSCADALLADSSDGKLCGGTGKLSNWALAALLGRKKKIVLAGGISGENVSQAIEKVSPWCVDVNSSVELSPRKKDAAKLTEFFKILER